ncbi:MAG: PAS domain-containing protein, partial [Candidatus Caldatribacteriaceae bacterium]
MFFSEGDYFSKYFKQEKRKEAHFWVSLFSASFSLHVIFFLVSGKCLFSWRFGVNLVALFFLTIFSLRFLFPSYFSIFCWLGLWFIFLGEALFLLEYPPIFDFQESLHGSLLLAGVLFVSLGFWDEKRKARYRLAEELLQGITAPAIFLDREGRIWEINAKTEELLGYSLTEVRGTSFVVFLPEAMQDRAWKRFREIWKAKDAGQEFRFWVITKKGQEMLVQATLLFSVTGEKEGLVFELRDVTRSRAHYLSFYREGRKLRNYLEAVQDFFIVLDREGKIRYLNQAGASLLGVKRRAILGMTLD